jgi:hypothetical protein
MDIFKLGVIETKLIIMNMINKIREKKTQQKVNGK